MDELLFIAITLIDLAFALLAFRQGKEWLYTFIVVNLILVTIISGKTVNVFGFATTMGGPFYAAIFLATDALTEHYGKNEGHKSVLIGFMSLLIFVVFAQLSLLVTPADFSKELHSSMEGVFSTSLRIFFASAIAYVIAQNFDVWFYHFLQSKTNGRLLWLRNNVSTITSQCLDGLLFFSIAFYGVLDNWLEIALTGTIVKIMIAMFDTPFIYATKKIKKRDASIGI